jgi:hypothetical protein
MMVAVLAEVGPSVEFQVVAMVVVISAVLLLAAGIGRLATVVFRQSDGGGAWLPTGAALIALVIVLLAPGSDATRFVLAIAAALGGAFAVAAVRRRLLLSGRKPAAPRSLSR